MTCAACFTPADQGVFAVADDADCSAAVAVYTSDFTGAESQCDEVAFGTEDLSGAACSSCHLAALACCELNVVNDCTIRHVAKFHRIADLDICVCAGDNCVTDIQSFRADDVALFTVNIVDQCDVSVTVRIVFDRCNLSRYIILVSLEVDNSVFLLGTAAMMACGDLTGVVSAALLA